MHFDQHRPNPSIRDHAWASGAASKAFPNPFASGVAIIDYRGRAVCRPDIAALWCAGVLSPHLAANDASPLETPQPPA